MSNDPPRLPSHRPASLAHLPAHDHSGWRPLGSGPFLDIPSLSNLPILDGLASIALSQPASPLVGPVEAPNRRLVRRRNAERNLRGAASPRSNRSATPFPRDNNVPHPEPPPAAAQAPAAAPAPAPAPAPQVQWAGNPPAPNRIASDVARAADERHLLRLKQSLTDRFLCYHTSIDTLLYWDRDQRRPLWRRMPIPLYQGEWSGHPPVQPGEELDAVFSYQQALDEDEESRQQATQSVRGLLHRLRRIHRNRSRPRNHDDDGGGGGGRRPTPDRLTTKLVGKFQPAGIQFKRRLGQGGFGAVFLFEMVGEKGVIHPVVVKGSTRELRDGPDAFSGELENINVSCKRPLGLLSVSCISVFGMWTVRIYIHKVPPPEGLQCVLISVIEYERSISFHTAHLPARSTLSCRQQKTYTQTSSSKRYGCRPQSVQTQARRQPISASREPSTNTDSWPSSTTATSNRSPRDTPHKSPKYSQHTRLHITRGRSHATTAIPTR